MVLETYVNNGIKYPASTGAGFLPCFFFFKLFICTVSFLRFTVLYLVDFLQNLTSTKHMSFLETNGTLPESHGCDWLTGLRNYMKKADVEVGMGTS